MQNTEKRNRVAKEKTRQGVFARICKKAASEKD
jgi:hypothetical protein